MGSKWRMPTDEECAELINNTKHESVVINGINGTKFISKIDSSKYIFLPFAGVATEGSFEVLGIIGGVWSSSVSSDNPEYAYSMVFNDSACGIDPSNRCDALPVRGVC